MIRRLKLKVLYFVCKKSLKISNIFTGIYSWAYYKAITMNESHESAKED